MENFWSLVKRTLGGIYVSVEPFHFFRYLGEQEFRYNNRGNKTNPIRDEDFIINQVSFALKDLPMHN